MYTFLTHLASKLRSFTTGMALGYTDALGTARTRAFAAAPGAALAPSAVGPRHASGPTATAARAAKANRGHSVASARRSARVLTLENSATAEPTEEESRLATYFQELAGLPTPSLNALDNRSPSYLDIIAYLVDTGRTPATSQDIQEAFAAVHQRVPGPAELRATMMRVADFGLLGGTSS